jgi:hypothetical protein
MYVSIFKATQRILMRLFLKDLFERVIKEEGLYVNDIKRYSVVYLVSALHPCETEAGL